MAFPADNPDWATDDFVFPDGTDNKVRPTPNLRQYGFVPDSFPTAQEINWMFNNFAEQIAELKSQVAAPSQVPIGMVVELSGTTANPNSLFGYGVWTIFGQGRVTIGSGSATDSRGVVKAFNAGATGGEYEHLLSAAEMPTHTHTGGIVGKTGGAGWDIEGYPSQAPSNDNYKTAATSSAGGSQSHNNIQPYIVVNKWLRVS